MIVNFHRLNTNNVGDLRSAPCRYFEIADFRSTKYHEILGSKTDELPFGTDADEWLTDLRSADIIVVGGGGLLGCNYFTKGLDFITQNRKSDSHLVVWGAGHNEWKLDDWRNLKYNLEISSMDATLIGVRDFGQPYEWVPCASCLDPVFDKPIEPVHEVGLYVHSESLNMEDFCSRLPQNCPTLSNYSEFTDAISFISSCDTVLTDSYHGVYWATLLKRKVIAFPSSSKFYDLKYPVPLCVPEDWERFRPLTHVYEEALDDCRNANSTFAARVCNLT